MQKFLLHTCCAPCSIAIVDELRRGVLPYDPTVFFYNPNIYPEEEYKKRKKYVVEVCEEWGVKMVDCDTAKIPPVLPLQREGLNKADYEREKWNEAVKGLENEPEGGARCAICFRLRLEKAAQYAAEQGFEIFSTSLTFGRSKRAAVINPIGQALAEKYGVKYLAEDWKKGGRQEKGRRMVEKRGIYRQNYCGCIYSMREGFHELAFGHTNVTNIFA